MVSCLSSTTPRSLTTDENGTVRQFQRLNCDLAELLTGTQPDDLCLLFVQLQAIAVRDPRYARRQTIRRIRMVYGWRADVDLCERRPSIAE